MKKALQLSGKVNMIDQFCIPNIKLLQSMGYSVSVVSDFSDPGTITSERANKLKMQLTDLNVHIFDVPFPRSLNFHSMLTAYKKTKEIIEKEQFDLIHCHSPIGAAICRVAAKKARKRGTKIVYTAHGFHFYKGAPLKNWIFFYPAEKILSHYTDALITINQEDYMYAKKHFKKVKIYYLPGIGIDLGKFFPSAGNRERIREEMGLNESQIMVLSVGELNNNKNHERVIRSIQGLDYVYVIVGKGKLNEHLEQVARECNVSLHLMGYRSDIIDFYAAADVFVLPSIREGLNVSLMEAMACGIPIACSDIRGNTDLIDSPLFNPKNETDIRNSISLALENRIGLCEKNLAKIQKFGLDQVNEIMRQIYAECI